MMLATCLDAHLVACPPRLRRALVEAGFNNVHDVCHLSAMDLAKEIGASPEDAQQVIDLAKSKAVGACMGAPITFRTALDLFEVRLFPSPSSPRTKAHPIPPSLSLSRPTSRRHPQKKIIKNDRSRARGSRSAFRGWTRPWAAGSGQAK